MGAGKAQGAAPPPPAAPPAPPKQVDARKAIAKRKNTSQTAGTATPENIRNTGGGRGVGLESTGRALKALTGE